MGCWASVPHANRRYRDPADLDEYYDYDDPDAKKSGETLALARHDDVGKIRRFGNWRNGQANQPPDDIGGLPSCHMRGHLATDPDLLLYEAEIDQGHPFRCFNLGCL
ncbi:hypothetical protein THAOC_19590 [Thalassiosira oceanica]|uniref:Uncharacterized protein n=1 Tax=Thalassiosira oceanica TaxID=159749 RepID=K0S4B5_THAOC|nr:hypothetical protein THAOC_19590 [Thalassiosira oceanica]|eukprot:EJK60120.1 hypothetical protein THAOC_19590 [Thalassiosira oceanica]